MTFLGWWERNPFRAKLCDFPNLRGKKKGSRPAESPFHGHQQNPRRNVPTVASLHQHSNYRPSRLEPVSPSKGRLSEEEEAPKIFLDWAGRPPSKLSKWWTWPNYKISTNLDMPDIQGLPFFILNTTFGGSWGRVFGRYHPLRCNPSGGSFPRVSRHLGKTCCRNEWELGLFPTKNGSWGVWNGGTTI